MIQIVCYIILGFAFIQWITIVINYFFRQTIPRGLPSYDLFISILIPARNEEKNIGELLTSLRDIGSNVEILVYDDLSTDQTASIVEEHARIDSRIRLIR
ncbi:MAG TPA: glycosyltransferase, partial [Salinivirgaceae bacterium]|nr:glycosyltransferase [Salinivirgaceae bacterium]